MHSSKSKLNPTTRFSNRVEFYTHYRPKYPSDIISFLQRECGLTPESIIADIGSGTGFLCELFLRNKNTVFGVEPNKEMREAGEKLLAAYRSFSSIDGTAEATNLQSANTDFVTAGQAFHWFGIEKSRQEFMRILKSEGWVVLIWNDRRIDTTPFLKDYEELLQTFGTDYAEVDHKKVDAATLTRFFGQDQFKLTMFDNFQHLDFAGLKGRLLSSSYIPVEGQPNYVPMMKEAEKLFKQYQVDGKITLEYDAKVYTGQIKSL